MVVFMIVCDRCSLTRDGWPPQGWFGFPYSWILL